MRTQHNSSCASLPDSESSFASCSYAAGCMYTWQMAIERMMAIFSFRLSSISFETLTQLSFSTMPRSGRIRRRFSTEMVADAGTTINPCSATTFQIAMAKKLQVRVRVGVGVRFLAGWGIRAECPDGVN
jgi:hypothetical protein